MSLDAATTSAAARTWMYVGLVRAGENRDRQGAKRAFRQALQIDPDAIAPLFERISNDDRHGRVRLVLRRSVEEREFASWSMGFVRLERGASVPGFVDVLRDARAIDAIVDNPGRAVDLVRTFREGRWRQSA